MIGDARRADPARRFPFCAVMDQPDAQLALLLAAVDPAIGGVLLRGDKGSARSTLARGLAGLLPGSARFVDVSLGVSEDRVLGSIDVTPGPTDRETQFRAGLLAAAHGGVLHLSSVNLLPEHLVEVLLEVATSGINRVERSGVWHEHPARFVLVASMDPDAGELRPQLLDRFGLSVDVRTPDDPAVRAEVVRRRLTHDSGGLVDGHEGDIVLRARLAAALPADLPTAVVDFACHLAAGLGAEGLRGDLVLCRAAAAFAGWEGRSITTEGDVERVAPLALGHRRRRRPFHPPALAPGELERALDATRQAFVAVGNGAGGLGGAPVPEPSPGGDQPMATAGAPGVPGDPGDATAGEEPEEARDASEPAEVTAGDETTDERPAGDEPTDEVTAGAETTDEPPAGDEPTVEVTAGDETTDERPAGEEPTDERPAGEETGPDAGHGKERESEVAGGANATGADPRAVRAAAEAAMALVDLGGPPKKASAGSEPAAGVDEATAKPPPTTDTDEPAAHGS
jgi:magnesium chelatase subunit D